MDRRLLPTLLLLASCGRAEYPSFRDAQAAAICEHDVRCGFLDPAARPHCEEYWRALPAPPPNADPQQSIDAGRAVFDADAAQRCLQAITGQDCVYHRPLQLPDGCLQVTVGQVPSGGPCASDRDCGTGLGCALDSDDLCAHCRPLGAPGGSCPCRPDSRCRNENNVPTCVLLGIAGASCDDSFDCRPGLVCLAAPDFKSGHCQAPVGAGEPCFSFGRLEALDSRHTCQPGLVCDVLQQPPVCAPPARANQPCAAPDACDEGLLCRGFQSAIRFQDGARLPDVVPGICQAPSSVGESCAPTEASGCSNFQRCGEDGLCHAGPVPGDACDPTVADACWVGFCDSITRRCRSLLREGDTCDPEHAGPQCGGPDACDPVTRTCASYSFGSSC